MEKLRRKGKRIDPVQTAGRKIAESFWGRAWCTHLEKFSDFANRLPRGRTYVRNGSVCHLEIGEGNVDAIVSGSELYDVSVRIAKLAPKRWAELKGRCMRGIGSLLELLQGRISAGIMAVVTDRDAGLFPAPREIDMDCSCPDWATMCKHVAAVLYGVGARLDQKPDLLFVLRGVKAEELVVEGAVTPAAGRGRKLAEADIAEVFGIDVEGDGAATGEAVAALRRQFGMSRREFARLLGVSVPAVRQWELKRGPLTLRGRSRRSWEAVARLDRAGAWERLGPQAGELADVPPAAACGHRPPLPERPHR